MNSQVPLAGYKQITVTNQRLFYVIIGQLVLLFAAIIPYYFVFPLKETNIEFVEFQSGTNNFVKIAKAGKEFTNKELLIAMFLRRYITDRETVNKVDEIIRYPRVMAFSSDRISQNFKRTHGGKGALYLRDNFKRSIVITRDGALDTGLHQLEFITEDTTDNEGTLSSVNSKPTAQEWIASIEYHFDKQSVSFDTATLNPLGLKVIEYSLSRRKK